MKEDFEKLIELANKSINSYNLSLEKVNEKLQRKNFNLLFSPEREGFIAGYEDFEDAECMFIWLFGVLPESQGKGIGSALLKQFEDIAVNKGYKKIRSYTYNKFKSKIILSINKGYRIVGVDFDKERKDYRILLEKDLTEDKNEK